MPRNRAFKSRILVAMAATLLVVVAVAFLFIGRAVSRTMYRQERQAAENALRLVMMDIHGRDNSVRFYAESALGFRKRQLMDEARNVTRAFDLLAGLADSGALSAKAARDAALKYAEAIQFTPGGYFFIYDQHCVCIAHVDKRFIGRDLRDLRDRTGKHVLRELMEAARKPGGGFVRYYWQRPGQKGTSPKLSYALWYARWKWLVGTGVYIDDIEKAVDEDRKGMIADLDRSLADVRIARTGRLFIVDGDGRVVVDPGGRGKGQGAARPWPVPKLSLARLKEAVQDGRDVVPFEGRPLSHAPGRPGRDLAFVRCYKPLNWYVVAVVSEAELAEPGWRMLLRLGMVEAVVFAAGLLVVWWLSSRVSRPLVRLTDQVRALGEAEFQGDPAALEAVAKERSDEIGRLAEAFAEMQRRLAGYLRDLTRTTAAKARTDGELRIAQSIQRSFLPRPDSLTGLRGRVDVAADLRVAREVGGDLYDFFMLDADRLAVVLGDVSGKGVPAALFMAVARTLVRSAMRDVTRLSGRTPPPDGILDVVNPRLAYGNDHFMFVTLILGVLDLRTGRLKFTNAGHTRPRVLSPEGVRLLTDRHGPPLGVRPKRTFRSSEFVLRPGDAVFLFTDGVTEARDGDGAFFGDARLDATLTACREDTPAEIVRRVHAAVDAFVGDAPPSDDRAMLVFRYNGPSAAAPDTDDEGTTDHGDPGKP